MTRICSAGMGALLSVMGVAAAQPHLDTPLTDHAVVQRDAAIPLSGTGTGDISISFGGETVTARVDENGRWEASLPAMDAGGPYALKVSDSAGTLTLDDILVGDVWLCSGQSNMALQVSRALNNSGEVAFATDSEIRLLTVAQDYASTPMTDFKNKPDWQVLSPETAGDFSATCYFTARELKKTEDVPMGLINSSWGGSRIEAWMDTASLSKIDGYEDDLALLETYREDAGAGNAEYGEKWMAWWEAQQPGSQPWAVDDTGAWKAAPAALGDWKLWDDADLKGHLGMVWHRTRFDVPTAQAGEAATLYLGQIDELDAVWINGQYVAGSFGWGTARVYDVPAGILTAGENTIVVNVLNGWGQGGLLGPVDTMRLDFAGGPDVAIGEGWEYRFVPRSVGWPPRMPWVSISGLTSLYNAMIAPLGPMPLKGAIWYQGESNTDEGTTYEALMTGMIADWRTQFGEGLPFIIVQLPNFGERPTEPAESGWSDVREGQRRAALADPAVGLAVAIDAGDVWDIHPANKQIIGRRVAGVARHLLFGAEATGTGPVPGEPKRSRNRIVIPFADIDGSLKTVGSDQAMAFELCGEEGCAYTEAMVEDGAIVLSGKGVRSADKIRYCWGDAPVCNLYDESGLPVGPFEIAID